MARLEDWIREACDTLDRCIRRGESRRVEDLLASHPGERPAPELLLELIYTEFVARYEVGLDPDPEEYFARFPELVEDLRELFFVHRIVHAEEDAAEGISESETGPLGETAASDRPEPIAEDAPVLAMLGRYALLEVIGEGATAKVYKARDTRLKRLVAVKILPRGEEKREDGPPREAEAAAALRHPNIVQVYEVGETDDCRYVVMELLEGGTAADRRGQPWKPRQAARLVETLARAVQFAHDHGILHRDLKPGNVLLDHDGTPKISDFGLAVRVERGRAASRQWLVGTPGYAAPEQIWGRSETGSPAGDIYGLGAILYELLTGRPPFRGRNAMETMLLVKRSDPVSPQKLQPHLHRDLAVICLKCLEKDPGKRYPSAAALADDLRRFLEGHVITARPADPLERAAKWFHRNRTAASAGAIAALLLAGLALTRQWYESRLEQEMHGKAVLAEVTARQEQVLRSQQDLARQQRYAEALSQAGQLLADNPGAAEAVLHDPRQCPEDLRDFAWRLLDRLASAGRKDWDLFPPQPEDIGEAAAAVPPPESDSQPVTQTAGQPERTILRLAASPDGRRLAVGCADGTLLLWDARERVASAQTHVGNHVGNGVTALAFSPDGSALAAADGDEVTLWSVPELKLLRRWDAAAQAVRDLVFTGKGEGLLAATDAGLRAASCREEANDAAAAMRTLRMDLGTFVSDRRLWARPPLRPPRNFQPDLTCLAVDPEATAIFCGTAGGRSFLLSWPKLTLTAVFREFNEPVSAAAFSPDGTLLAAASGSSVWLYQRRTGVSRYLREAHFRPIVATAFSPDGRQ
ncbi:MAG: protein kinase, partial [Thermogutta sp.]|nr:protein kinase [Thermogutta sp.]